MSVRQGPTPIELGLIAALIATAAIGAMAGLSKDDRQRCDPAVADANGVYAVPAHSCVEIPLDSAPAQQEETAPVSNLT